jgi:hypothetical protein
VPITYAHVFLNFEILSSNGGLVSAFGYTILVLVPGFFLEKKNHFSHLAMYWFWVQIQKAFTPVWFWNQVQG